MLYTGQTPQLADALAARILADFSREHARDARAVRLVAQAGGAAGM
ncbi:hypothetical protein [Kocuria salsicia]|nr:hypothetical protein [Kocuria salsicia]